MKQYKTLKDMPGVKAGTIGIRRGESSSHHFANMDKDGTENVIVFDEYDIKRFPDFFEEAIELDKLFTIEDMNISWHRAWNNDISDFNRFISNEYPQHIDQLKYLK